MEDSKYRAENALKYGGLGKVPEQPPMSPNKEVTSQVDPNELAEDPKLGFSPSDISVIESTMSSPKIN